MKSVKEIAKLKVFERNKVPLEINWYSNLHSNIVSKKDCQNPVRASSCLKNSSLELDKEIWGEITDFNQEEEKKIWL